MSEWIEINESQPKDYQDVLWFCVGGKIQAGMYFGEDHCKNLPMSHPMAWKGRASFGKYGRYAEPAGEGYKVTHWMPLPEPPQ